MNNLRKSPDPPAEYVQLVDCLGKSANLLFDPAVFYTAVERIRAGHLNREGINWLHHKLGVVLEATK